MFYFRVAVIMSIGDGIYFYTNRHTRTTTIKASRDPMFLSRDGAAPVGEVGQPDMPLVVTVTVMVLIGRVVIGVGVVIG